MNFSSGTYNVALPLFAWQGIAQPLLCSKSDDISPEQKEAELREAILNAQKGDNDSFEWIIRRHLPFISEEITKFCPRSAVEDVAQEVLIRAYQALPKYKESGAFRWWLKRITTRACLDYWRAARRSEKVTRAYSEDFGQGSLTPQETLLCDLDRFMGQLSADDRMVFTLACLEDRPHNEIAALLGISLVAAKVRCFRLKQKMREWLTL